MLRVLGSVGSAEAPFKPDPYFETAKSKCDASQYKVYSIEDAKQLFGDRDLYIWGAGQKGRGFLLALRRCGFEAKGFLDSSPDMVGADYMGIKVSHPDSVLHAPNAHERVFVLTATVDVKNKEIIRTLESAGFARGKSFETIQTLSPFYPTVEITGLCNLKCSGCARADRTLFEPGKFMSFADYEKVIRKLVAEIPFLYLVDLYVFGEPILNKDLPAMIELNNSLGIASGLSTNLNDIRNLEPVLAAYPAQLRVSLSGMSPETYEVTHTGGDFVKVLRNMETLSELNARFGNRTLIELYYHVYKHNVDELSEIIDLCKRLGFRFHPSLGIVLSSDFVLQYAQTGVLPEPARAADDLTLIGLREMVDDCEKHGEKSCILTRIVPVINWDLSVMACCNYAYNGIAKSYLDIELAELIGRRTYSKTCASCQKHSIHRWNNQGYYSGYVKKVVDEALAKAAAVNAGAPQALAEEPAR